MGDQSKPALDTAQSPHYCSLATMQTISRQTLLRHAKAQLLEALDHFHPSVIRVTMQDLLAGDIDPASPDDCLLGTLAQYQWCAGIELCSGEFGRTFHRRCVEKAERELGYRFVGQTYLEQYLLFMVTTKGEELTDGPVVPTIARWMGQYLAAKGV